MWAELQKQTVIHMGDLNLNRMDTNKREGKLLIDLEESFNLTCLINSPTRITNVSSTLIDVMLTNRPDYFIKSGTFDPEISDHCLIYGILNEKTIHYQQKTIMSRNLKSITFEPIAEELTNALWQVGEVFNDIDDRVDYWNGLVRDLVDAHAPLRKKRVREIDVPYMTLNWKNAIRRKRKYAQLYAKNKTAENYDLKKKYRNLATKERRKAIKEFWMKKTDDLKQKPWESFKAFRPSLGKSKGSNTIILETEGNAAETNESIISNKFAQYITNIASTIGGNHVLDLSEEDHKNHTSINAIRKEQLDIDFEFQPITEHDLYEELASINTKKPPGWDSVIPPIVFKEISHAISLSLQSMFNQCIEDCSWPTKWKMGE